MDRIRALLGEIRDFLFRSRAEAEMKEEMDFHLEMEARANLNGGMTPEEARRKAVSEFGGRDWYAERVRSERRSAFLWDLGRDVCFGLRVLRKRPVFALAAVLTLSIGVGMTATMFTLVDAVILRPLPGSNAEGMVYLFLETADGRVSTSPSPEFLRLVRDHVSAFSGVEAYSTRDHSLSVAGEPLREMGATASVGFFSFLGVRPQLGRAFLSQDGSGSQGPVVVLSHTFWTERFGGARNVLGRTMVIDGRTHQIVGVLPRDFRVDTPREALFWIPESAAGELLSEGVPVEGALAILADGVSVAAAEAELNAVVENNPLTRRGGLDWVARIRTPEDLVDPSLKRAILLLQGGAFLVLLIACLNLVNLLLAQGEARARELAVRASLGAGKVRLVRQLMAETAVLGIVGSAGGLFLTTWALDSLPVFLPPGYAGFTLNREVFIFSLGASILSVLVAGLLPARKGAKRGLMDVIKGNPEPRHGMFGRAGVRKVLVTAEVAMAFVLLSAAGLLTKSLSGLMASDVGFPREDLLTLRVELPEDGYEDEGARRNFLQSLQNGIRAALPTQLGSATVANGLVENLAVVIGALVPEGVTAGDQEDQALLTWKVAPDYFDVLGLPISQGRAFQDEEGPGSDGVVIVNDEVARRYFPQGNAPGSFLQLNDQRLQVVGVAKSVKLPGLAQSSIGGLQLFFPLERDVGRGFTIIARVQGDRTSAVERLREAVWALDRSLPIIDVSLVEDALAESLGEERSNALLMGLFALTALALGAVGIYGVVAYSVSRKTREMGIRLALGASSGAVVRRVVVGSMGAVSVGILLGAVGALALVAPLSGLLVEVDPRDPTVFFSVAAVTVVVALTATWLPARRAARSDPLDALRAD